MTTALVWSVRIAVAVGAVTGVSSAQAPLAPTFEVASVKPNRSAAPAGQIFMLTDRFDAIGVTLRGLISLAYGEAGPPPKIRPSDQIAGGPDWMNGEFYDVVAKTGSDVAPGPAGVGPKLLMLRSLLEQRFKLVVHHEDREVPLYTLVPARNDGRLGPQLRRLEVDCRALLMAQGPSQASPLGAGQRPLCRANVAPGGRMVAGALTMADFANALSRLMRQVVVDRTGLPGSYDLDLQFSPQSLEDLAPARVERPAPATEQPSLFTALQEQLGLRLESTRGRVEVLVVERAERPDPD